MRTRQRLSRRRWNPKRWHEPARSAAFDWISIPAPLESQAAFLFHDFELSNLCIRFTVSYLPLLTCTLPKWRPEKLSSRKVQYSFLFLSLTSFFQTQTSRNHPYLAKWSPSSLKNLNLFPKLYKIYLLPSILFQFSTLSFFPDKVHVKKWQNTLWVTFYSTTLSRLNQFSVFWRAWWWSAAAFYDSKRVFYIDLNWVWTYPWWSTSSSWCCSSTSWVLGAFLSHWCLGFFYFFG